MTCSRDMPDVHQQTQSSCSTSMQITRSILQQPCYALGVCLSMQMFGSLVLGLSSGSGPYRHVGCCLVLPGYKQQASAT